MSHDKRLKALERNRHTRLSTAADIIAGLRAPRNADEFIIWERSRPEEHAAVLAIARQELAEWEQRKKADEHN